MDRLTNQMRSFGQSQTVVIQKSEYEALCEVVRTAEIAAVNMEAANQKRGTMFGPSLENLQEAIAALSAARR